MVRGVFQHRSGRVIAVGRAVLAIYFLLAIWLDHSQPALAVGETHLLLGFYLAFAAAMLLLTWNNWWLEARLALPAHGFDLLVYLWLNYATRGYASPFFIFFVFLILAGSIRWGWRGTAWTAAVIGALYLASALNEASWGTEEFDLRRFALRGSYLIALSSIVALWLASTQRPEDPARALLAGEEGGALPDADGLLRYAAGRLAAGRALFVWTDSEEPYVYAAYLENGQITEQKLGPEAFQPVVSPQASSGPFLFAQSSGRLLQRRGGRMRSLDVVERPIHPELAERYGARKGLRIPVRSGSIRGDILVLDVPGLCSDDIQLAEEAAERIAATLEQRERFQATEEAASMRARLAVGRDLHDSVVQFLAGLTFRLEGLKRAAGNGADLSEEVEALQHELVREQRDLRRMIAELRGAGVRGGEIAVDLGAGLADLGTRLEAQWGLDFRLAAPDAPIMVPPDLERHAGQLVREAAANAVRHGAATRIDARLARANGSVELELADNGSGFAVAGEFGPEEMQAQRIGPTSLRERVHNLGGELRLRSSVQGATLQIRLPLERAG